MYDEALTDVTRSKALNEDNSYIYLVQGMYLLEMNELEEALLNFERAKKLDSKTVLVDDYIVLAKNKMAGV